MIGLITRKRNSSREVATILLSVLIMLVACNGGGSENDNLGDKELWNKLEDVNKVLAGYEKEEITSFISRRGWEMAETGTGLWYQIYREGRGMRAAKEMKASMAYSVMLLTGEEVYSSEIDGIKEFIIGYGGVEAGLEEGILLMRQGDRARFIMPPHLAHGFHGDGKKIPRRATIVYDVELLKLQELK